MKYRVYELVSNITPTRLPRELIERKKTYRGRTVVRVYAQYSDGGFLYHLDLEGGDDERFAFVNPNALIDVE